MSLHLLTFFLLRNFVAILVLRRTRNPEDESYLCLSFSLYVQPHNVSARSRSTTRNSAFILSPQFLYFLEVQKVISIGEGGRILLDSHVRVSLFRIWSWTCQPATFQVPTCIAPAIGEMIADEIYEMQDSFLFWFAITDFWNVARLAPPSLGRSDLSDFSAGVLAVIDNHHQFYWPLDRYCTPSFNLHV